ncbi:TOMM precursor leader peptide-binding protein [Streptomyces sp. ISL-86]|uniref:TOMM precursor leader peptide-binding protein n=1 Tax=Streptomyces sp. ISL-86 TaxID=2819187 RepID=UPI001BE6E5D6|nr:TOMM precursor leader peptide-binding protein [Streptomyces sp. ISL-86]MBT2454180.1 TOMM precursor leader peptide-binding protein [Streptomyces sp. ISL-86]
MTKVHVLAVGDFGTAVADRLFLERRDIAVTSDVKSSLEFSSVWPEAQVRILASWRETPRLAELLDARSADWGTTWFPVVAEHPRLRIGPVVVPGEGACYRCFRQRRSQHERDSSHTATLHAHYDASPAAGTAGFLPHHVDMAAGMALDVLRRVEAGETEHLAGNVRHWHVLEQHVTGARVVGVHGCDRCRPRPVDPTSATWEQLARDLAPWPVLAGEAASSSSSGPTAAPSISAHQ